MKNWLAGILCAILVIGAIVVYFINNGKKIKYESEILVKYEYGGGMGNYLDTHATYITVYSDGTYLIEIPTENNDDTKKYKISGNISDTDFENLKKIMQKNNLKKLTKTDLSSKCDDCGFESLSVYYSDDDIYTVSANETVTIENASDEEKIFINIRDAVANCIPKEKIYLLERALADDYSY